MTTVVVGVLALLGVLVTAAVQVYNARAFPTLDRRVREHTALAKDMPDAIAEPLRKLLTEEVNALVVRERLRLTPASERRAGRTRVLIALGYLATLAVLIAAAIQIVTGAKQITGPPSDWLFVAMFVLLGMSGIALVSVMVSLVIGGRQGFRTGPAVYYEEGSP